MLDGNVSAAGHHPGFVTTSTKVRTLGAQIRATLGGFLVVAFLAGSIFGILTLAQSQPLDSLATPTKVSKEEIEAVAAIFLVWVAVLQPARDALDRSKSSISRLLRIKVDLPRSIRAIALALLIFGSFAFAFWSIADVLGGYNGYGYSFSTYPILPLIYHNTIGLVPYLSSQDKGTQASFYFSLGILGLIAFRLNRGIGAALKDAITLFAAPCLVLFELAIWNYAPEDMTWHVTDYLWMGGVADGGWRAFDNGGAYLVSNWLVLFVALFFVATRIPWISLPSKMLWQRRRTELQENNAIIPVARASASVGFGGPLGWGPQRRPQSSDIRDG
ncbi:MAG: hypothetical protein OK455_05245 [Thaumarchaeota archaeon]|nr:hypothetical protein [Nitrososphaerota archaeon]